MDRAAVELGLAQMGARYALARGLAEALDTEKAMQVPFAATIQVKAIEADVFIVGALTANATIAAPLNAVAGRKITFMFTQGATARTLTWDPVFRKAADGAASANQKGTVAFRFDGSNWVQAGGALAWA